MEEKRLKITIGTDGNYKIQTLSGFVGNQCEQTIDEITASVGGKKTGEGDTDDKYKTHDPSVFADSFE